MSLRDAATGESLVDEIHFTNQDSAGARSSLLPDAIVTLTPIEPPAQIDSHLIGSISGRLRNGRRGNHRADGGHACAALPGNGSGQAITFGDGSSATMALSLRRSCFPLGFLGMAVRHT